MSTTQREEGLRLQLEQLIFSECSQVCISTRSKEPQDVTVIKTRIGNFILSEACGGKNLSHSCAKPMYEVTQTRITDAKGKLHTEMIKGREFRWYEKIAKSLSITYPISEEEVKALLLPYLRLGSTKLFLATACNSHGISNKSEPEVMKALGIEKNEWLVFGDIVTARPTYNGGFHQINEVLARDNLSDLRIRNVGTDLVAEQQQKIDELQRIVEALQRKLA